MLCPIHVFRYKEIGRIMELNTKVEDIREQLATQITLEFKKAFRRPELDRDADVATLAESCAVMDVLGADVKEKFVAWFVNLQLRDYRSTYGDLDIILEHFSRHFSAMYPLAHAVRYALLRVHAYRMVLGAWCLVLGAWCLVLGAWCLQPDGMPGLLIY